MAEAYSVIDKTFVVGIKCPSIIIVILYPGILLRYASAMSKSEMGFL
jgi:hypothetical protein